jgi:hypothetical protein
MDPKGRELATGAPAILNQQSTRVAVSGLRWMLGLVILLESAHFALGPATAREVANVGLPHWIPLALGGNEALAALLFLVSPLTLIGGYMLLALPDSRDRV